MRTNIIIDDELIQRARQLTGIKTKREVVQEALRILIQLREQTDVRRLIADFSFLVDVIDPDPIEPVVLVDPDDDAVLACALTARADVIVSGDADLLRLGRFRDIPVLTPADLSSRLQD